MKQKTMLMVFSICLVGLLTAGLSLVPGTRAQRSGSGSSTPGTEQRIQQASDVLAHANAAGGCAISQAVGTVTSIKEIKNKTSQKVRLWKIDEKPFNASEQTIEVAPNSTVTGDFWIPWADGAAEYQKHRMTISVGDRSDFIHFWQSGLNVRFSAGREFADNAPPVPGVSKSGGDRTLVIGMADGQPTFVLVGRGCPPLVR